jgi:hypothetical protein
VVRIGCEHAISNTTNARTRVAPQQSDGGFADTLASALEATDGDSSGPEPELSAATYRLFAAIDLERGDTKHAALHLSRVPEAREAGIPLHPNGLLSETGRWDYTPAAAALSETGHYDSGIGQGLRTFIPYNTFEEQPVPPDCTGETATASSDARERRGVRAGSVRPLDT